MTVNRAREYGRNILKSAGITDWDYDSDAILSFVMDCERSDLILRADDELDDITKKRYEHLIDRRQARFPLQHLIGSTFFFGHKFIVNKDVLIPRQDTECLVEQAAKLLKPGMRVLDVCTGSGCIIISIALLMENEGYFAGTDISRDALMVALRNRDELSAKVEFFCGDMTFAIPNQQGFDIILSNPPYIKKKEIDTLMPEVRYHEPRIALDGGEDGLLFYRRLATSLSDFLNENGTILLEIGFDQAEDVSKIFADSGYKSTEVVKDYAGNDRVMIIKR